MSRFSKRRMRTRRTGKTRRTRRTRRTGRSRRGGEGERDAITDYDSARNDADWARGLTPQSTGPEENKLNKVDWEKLNENPNHFNSDNQYIMAEYKHLGPVKGGKTKRKMRKQRK